MYFLTDISQKLEMKTNTLRWWLEKNKKEYENGSYDVNISDLLVKIPIQKNKGNRKYLAIVAFDIEETIKQIKHYIYTVERRKEMKKQNNKSKLKWTYSAFECYENQLNCSHCEQRYICEKNIVADGEDYPMKKLVRKLLATTGTPYLSNVEYYNRAKIPSSIIQIKGA